MSSERLDRDFRFRQSGMDPDESRRKAMLDKKFGAGTYDRVSAWNEAQDCLCSLCHRPEETHYRGVRKHLMLDHCHSTGKIRGLICSRCNQALGHFADNPSLLRSAALYLKKRSTTNE